MTLKIATLWDNNIMFLFHVFYVLDLSMMESKSKKFSYFIFLAYVFRVC